MMYIFLHNKFQNGNTYKHTFTRTPKVGDLFQNGAGPACFCPSMPIVNVACLLNDCGFQNTN